MYTTTTATREQVFKAVAAAQRAMERHVCSKSQFKFKCFSCGKMIHRGDKITRCMKATTGMTLRIGAQGANVVSLWLRLPFTRLRLVRTCGSISAVIPATGTKGSITVTSLLLRLYAGCQRNGAVRLIGSSRTGSVGLVAKCGSTMWIFSLR